MEHTLFVKDMLKHRFMVMAVVVTAGIVLASVAYYLIESRPPAAVPLPGASVSASDITATGDVEPLQNPDLSFAAGGRIAAVNVSVGDRVSAGRILASLDSAALEASRAQAEANVAAQQAKLDSLVVGPRTTDIAVRQAAVAQAEQSVNATYAGLSSALSDAYAKSVTAIRSTADALFSNPGSPASVMIFQTSDSYAKNTALSDRVIAGNELDAWQSELAAFPASIDLDAAIAPDVALSQGIGHLVAIRRFQDDLITALNAAVPTASFNQSAIASAQSALAASRATVNGLIASLTAAQQAIASQKLAVSAAQAALDQLEAGASPQDRAAQEAAVASAKAAVAGIDAQIANNVISAPFSGTVASVSIKAGQIAVPNAPALTILPDSPLQVVVTVSERDITSIAKGDAATVTLDAYGVGTAFPAHVIEVDAAPTGNGLPAQAGVRSYTVKLAFDAPDQSVKTGMTANAIIHPAFAGQEPASTR